MLSILCSPCTIILWDVYFKKKLKNTLETLSEIYVNRKITLETLSETYVNRKLRPEIFVFYKMVYNSKIH